ncbi:MAG: 23S rRNA pseudouridine(1911/1915/1917) synthase RluD [Burkholderiales bacterium]|nr:23S rRNA pseudouridine(1911/1915/1917) synthase RluD [Burkholderiales bacterium]
MSSPTDNPDQYAAIELIVPVSCAGLRLDQALARLLPQHSRSRLQSWIQEGRVILDGALATVRQKIRGGETVLVHPAAGGAELAYHPEDIALDIAHEDEALIIVNKPAGLVVHPGSGNWSGTLLNALLQHAPQLGRLPRAGIVHRLDKDTSGLLAIAKTEVAQTCLVRQLQARSVSRDYLAIVFGHPARSGKVEAPIGRHPLRRTTMAVVASGKPAVTYYRTLEQFAECALVDCKLETGRTHQIRVHLQSIGHPLVGDRLYLGKHPGKRSASPAISEFPRQALHATALALDHPATGKRVGWQVGLPEDMSDLLAALRSRGSPS